MEDDIFKIKFTISLCHSQCAAKLQVQLLFLDDGQNAKQLHGCAREMHLGRVFVTDKMRINLMQFIHMMILV